MADRYEIRRAVPGDGPEFVRLVEELAAFEKLAPPDAGARGRLVADALGPEARFELYVSQERARPGLVGYAIVLWTYSSFLAHPTLYLEDVYLTPAHRGTGLAQQLMSVLARRALDQGAGRMEGIVLDWNARARRFYQTTGAKELQDWLFFRYDEAAIRKLARANP